MNMSSNFKRYHSWRMNIDTDSTNDQEHSSTGKADTWEVVNRKVERMTNEVYNTWSSELTNLLIFASLFSAILTSFTVEAAKSIQIDPSEKAVSLLQTVVLQLNNISNPTSSLPIDINPDLDITANAQIIYLLYSVSLTLSLISVLGGITSFQWLREFNRNLASIPPKTDLYIQYQRHKSLRQWGVITLLNTLPILLLISLFLFFAGFMTSLWGSDAYAAIPVTILVGIAGLFILITSVLPALQILHLSSYKKHEFSCEDPSEEAIHPVLCPYRSPQAWFIHSLFHKILSALQSFSSLKLKLPNLIAPFDLIDDWSTYDTWWSDKHMTPKSIYPVIRWVATEFKQNQSVVLIAHECFLLAISDTCSTYMGLIGHFERRVIPDNTWTAFGFPSMVDFEEKFAPPKSIAVCKSRVGTFSRIRETMKEHRIKSTIFRNPVLHQILQADTIENRQILLRAIRAQLSNGVISELIGADLTCYVVDQVMALAWRGTIAAPIIQATNTILVDMCVRYKPGESYFHIQEICKKMRKWLTSNHQCCFLPDIFAVVYSQLNPTNVEDLAPCIGRALLVPCNDCKSYIDIPILRKFLYCVESAALQCLFVKLPMLDNFLLFTKHALEQASAAPGTLALERAFHAILLNAEDYVLQDPDATEWSVLHPNQFTLSRPPVTAKRSLTDISTTWRLVDNFNENLKEIWARREQMRVTDPNGGNKVDLAALGM